MVNYNKSIIYRLVCKDPSITDEYIGSTTNKNRRKQEHKYNCNNENSKKYDIPVYQFIRENGGIDNWDMIVLEEYSCENKLQLEMRERHWFEERKSTLNIHNPRRTEKEKKDFRKEYEKTEKRIEYNKRYEDERKNEEDRIQYKKQYEKTEKCKEYRKKYKQTDEYKEYQKQYGKQRRLKNKSAIIIQKFFKKYLR
jgi:hypothetical protein